VDEIEIPPFFYATDLFITNPVNYALRSASTILSRLPYHPKF